MKSSSGKFLRQAGLVLQSHLPAGARLLVAVSGGADSVSLLHFLRSQPYSLVVGHVDHRLRKGSARDARFVRRLARDWDLPYKQASVDVAAFSRRRRLGLEEAARDRRYRALAAMARQARCAAIVTAHTANDQAETVLMNFLRGAGPAGLAGMPSVRRSEMTDLMPVIRPFLGVTKEHVLRYVRRHSLAYRNDPSNRSLRFARNRLRHEVFPYLEKRYPGLQERLAQMADIFAQEEEFWHGRLSQELRKTARKDGKRFTVVLPQLLRYHKALGRRILRHLLPGLSYSDIEQVLTLARSPQRLAWIEFSGGWRVRRRGKTLMAIQMRNG